MTVTVNQREFTALQFDPSEYIRTRLKWEPWQGTDEQPGQREVIDAYTLALRQQHERLAWEAGELTDADLTCWQPGTVIQNRIRIEAGHTVGKTKLASGLVNHFFDCFVPSIIYTFAPSWEQIHDLLWKEIKADRIGAGLPGRVLDIELDRGADHFAKGRATNNAGGSGTERVQGQHGRFLMFVLDEAEGVADYIYDAVDSMTSGGISIVLMLANPRTRTSRFNRARLLANVRSFRISCLWHPNVLQDREIVPNAVRREYVDTMIDTHASVVPSHDPDHHTFEVPWRPGLIYQPDPEFMFRVLGEAPANLADNTMIPVGRYEAATQRDAAPTFPQVARIGVDVARFGKDYGTVYAAHNGRAWRAAQLYHQDTTEYAQAISRTALALVAAGVTSLHVRVDGGGGFGGGVIDQVARDLELIRAIPDFAVFEVHFNARPRNERAYADFVTELYAEAGTALHSLRLVDPPAALEDDLCDRRYGWVTWRGMSVKRLEPKDEAKKRLKRSPDDGDGFVLAVAPDHLFFTPDESIVTLPEADYVQIGPQL